jgi:Icc-related predicted phosphoesterase
MADTTKNVFISHVHEDDDGLQKLKDLLATKGIEIRDSSIHSGKPNEAKSEEYIKTILAPQIQWAGTFITYITPGTKDSEWVNWEIERAHKEGKRIVGVWGHGDNNCEVPEALGKYADAVVGWHGDRIVDAINGKINEWDNPDGTECALRPIARYSCN